jgi:hypothetical protein
MMITQDTMNKIKLEINKPPPAEKYLISSELYAKAEAAGYDMSYFQRWEPFEVISDERKAVAYCVHPVVQKFVESLR